MPREQWADIRFRRYFKVTPRKDARVLLQLAGSGDPILVERPLGRGKVLLFTSTADRAWTDMVVHPAYLMMVQQTVTYLTRKPYETPVPVSESVVFDLPAEGVPAALPIRDPRGEDIPVQVTDRDGHKAAVLASASQPGVYTVRWSQNAPMLKVAVNVDPQESAIAVLRGKRLDTVLRKLPVRLIGEGQDVRAAARESRLGLELWRTMLLVALAALAVEAVLGRWFARRMSKIPEVSARGVGVAL